MKQKNRLIVFIMVFLLGQAILNAESWSNIYGKVIDAETKEPVPKAWAVFFNIVDESGRKISTTTNEKGEFEFIEFPVDEYENILDISDPLDPRDTKYYKQRYRVRFKLQKGKNLYLKPIELKRGVRIAGTIKLWDGSIVERGRISINVKNRDEFDSAVTYWSALSWVTDGSYISALLPVDVELVIEADQLEDMDRGVAYGEVKKTIILKKDETNTNIDIFVPNIRTEIKGRVVNKNGSGLSSQTIGLRKIGCLIKTDLNGSFAIKHVTPGIFKLYVDYNINKFETYCLKNMELNEGDSFWIHIVLDSGNYFTYYIKKNAYIE